MTYTQELPVNLQYLRGPLPVHLEIYERYYIRNLKKKNSYKHKGLRQIPRLTVNTQMRENEIHDTVIELHFFFPQQQSREDNET